MAQKSAAGPEIVAQKVFKNKTVTVRFMRESDIDPVAQLEKQLFVSPWPNDSFRRELYKSVTTAIVLCIEKQIIGFAVFWLIQDEMEIGKIAVAPIYQNMGIASWTMELILNLARRHNVTRVFIEVRLSNTRAIRLYEKFGFQRQGTRMGYYSGPRENALLMTAQL